MYTFSDCTPVQQAHLSCENDTLTVTWSTNVVYDARVTRVPDDINQRVRERLLNSEAHLILNHPHHQQTASVSLSRSRLVLVQYNRSYQKSSFSA